MEIVSYIEVYPLPSASADGSNGNMLLALATGVWAKARDSHVLHRWRSTELTPKPKVNGKG